MEMYIRVGEGGRNRIFMFLDMLSFYLLGIQEQMCLEKRECKSRSGLKIVFWRLSEYELY